MKIWSFATVALCAVLLLGGCEKDATPAVDAAPAAAAAPAAVSVDHFGSITKHGISMPVRDYMLLPSENPLQVRLLLTPTRLTEAERAKVLENHRMPMMAFAFAESPDPAVWQWYPFAVLQMTFNEAPLNRNNLKGYYLMASGISKAYDTDNLNVYAYNNAFKTLDWSGEQGQLHFEDSDRDLQWNIQIAP